MSVRIVRRSDLSVTSIPPRMPHTAALSVVPISSKQARFQQFIREKNLTPEQIKILSGFLTSGIKYNKRVVGVEEFINSKHYANALNPDGSSIIYPEVMKALVDINEGGYDEAVLTGGIGSGKTSCALYTQLYQLYLLSCINDLHQLFGLDSTSEILFIFQSLNEKVATGVDYSRFKAMVDRSPYFEKHFTYDHTIKSELRFPNRIFVKPTATNISGAIGQNVIGGLIDEINYMVITKKSTQAEDGGEFDQAQIIYDLIDRRRKTRFMAEGKLPGVLCMASSKRYPGEFTDKKEEEAKREIERQGFTRTYIYYKRVWEVRPDSYPGKRFKIFAGDNARKPRIVKDDEVIADKDQHLVHEIPRQFYSKFEADMYGPMRDIAGISTAAMFPFIPDVEAIAKIFGKKESLLNTEEVDFDTMLLEFYPALFRDKHRKRWVHIDLGVSSDNAGVVCGYVDKFVQIKRGDQIEILPQIQIDFLLSVMPPKGGEILFYKIRELIYKMRERGLPVKWVSFDSFQSVDSIQIMRQKGYITGQVSMDKMNEKGNKKMGNVPYIITKAAIYDGRIIAPAHALCQHELTSLEKDPDTGRIDHPSFSSKDVSDALAGVVYGLTTRREVWAEFNVPLVTIPPSIADVIAAEKNKTLDTTGRTPSPYWARKKLPKKIPA